MLTIFKKNNNQATLLSIVILLLTIVVSPYIPAHLVSGIPVIIIWWYVGCLLSIYFLWIGKGSHHDG